MDARSFYEQPGILTKADPKARSRLIGDIATILLASDIHRLYSINDIGALFFPPIHLNQFKIYRMLNRPVGVVTWALLSADVDGKYAAGQYRLRPHDWNGGDHGWIIDFAAPFGHAAPILKDLRNNVFRGRTGKALRLNPRRGVKQIIALKGIA